MLQSVALAGWKKKKSLAPHELIYTPSSDVYALGAGGSLREGEGTTIFVSFTDDQGRQCNVTVRKGRNRNIAINIDGEELGKAMGSLEQPFAIFSPGLAGVAATEMHVSDGVLLRTVAAT